MNLLCSIWLIGSMLNPSIRGQIQELVISNPSQLSVDEYTYIAEIIHECAPCNVLVFGLGNDSALWHQINAGGKTVFLEHNLEWYERVMSKTPYLTSCFVRYHTMLKNWKVLLKCDPKDLAMDLPPEVMETCWDLIFVDAPEGYKDDKPGRMQSIYMASRLGQMGHAHVFVHDCDRAAEAAYCARFLADAHLIRSIDRLRHYQFKTEAAR